MGSEKFCIRWNDFENNISGAFREFKDDEDFFDVTLACDDEQIQAHKVILSACSPFFRNILRRNAHPAPLLYLKGVKYTDLQSVVNFMYHGEVNVAQEKLSSFLAVAEDLKVKGLTQNQTGNHKSKKESFTKSKSPVDKPSPHHPKKENQPSQLKQLLLQPLNINNSNQHMVDDDDIQEVNPIQSEPRDVPEAAQPPSPIYQPLHSLYQTQLQNSNTLAQSDDETLSYPDESYDDYGQYAEDKEYHGDPVLLHPTTAIQSTKGYSFQDPSDLLQFVRKDEDDQKFYCTLCDKFSLSAEEQTKFSNRYPSCIRNHVESIHFPAMFSYPCDECDSILSTKTSLLRHRSRIHSSKNKRKDL